VLEICVHDCSLLFQYGRAAVSAAI
jgi:hypothetical protein